MAQVSDSILTMILDVAEAYSVKENARLNQLIEMRKQTNMISAKEQVELASFALMGELKGIYDISCHVNSFMKTLDEYIDAKIVLAIENERTKVPGWPKGITRGDLEDILKDRN